MSRTTRRGLFGLLAALPIAAKLGFAREMAPEVPAKGYAVAGTGGAWENTRLRVALLHGEAEVSGRGYRRVLAESWNGKIQPLGTTRLRAEFPRAEGNWGLVDRYRVYDEETGHLVAKGRFNNWENPPYIAMRDTATFDLDIDIIGEQDDA